MARPPDSARTRDAKRYKLLLAVQPYIGLSLAGAADRLGYTRAGLKAKLERGGISWALLSFCNRANAETSLVRGYKTPMPLVQLPPWASRDPDASEKPSTPSRPSREYLQLRRERVLAYCDGLRNYGRAISEHL